MLVVFDDGGGGEGRLVQGDTCVVFEQLAEAAATATALLSLSRGCSQRVCGAGLVALVLAILVVVVMSFLKVLVVVPLQHVLSEVAEVVGGPEEHRRVFVEALQGALPKAAVVEATIAGGGEAVLAVVQTQRLRGHLTANSSVRPGVKQSVIVF